MPNHADTLIWNVQCSWNVCNNDNGHVIDVLIVWLVYTFGQFSSFFFRFYYFFLYGNGKEIWHAPIVPTMMTSKPVWRKNTSIICLVDIVYDFQLINISPPPPSSSSSSSLFTIRINELESNSITQQINLMWQWKQ